MSANARRSGLGCVSALRVSTVPFRFAGRVGEPSMNGCGPEADKMNGETIETEDNIVVPASVLVTVERDTGYGSVPGLDDDELADPAELERWVMIQEWGPILALPVQRRRWDIRPTVDENGDLDWGAFGTIDFDRVRPPLDKVRYKLDRLREELKDAVIMLSIVSERIPGRSKYLVLKYVRMGAIDIEHITDDDMRAIAKWYLRTRRLGKQIEELRRVRRRGWGQDPCSGPRRPLIVKLAPSGRSCDLKPYRGVRFTALRFARD